MSLLTRKAEKAGGKLIELATWRLRMSQYDHVSQACTKKPLAQRWHPLNGGPVLVQRDLYSAGLHNMCRTASTTRSGCNSAGRLRNRY